MKKSAFAALIYLLAVGIASAASVQGDPAPWADTLYVRGGFNDWGAVDPMTWDGVAYEATLTLDAGFYEFKIANETWDNPDFGPTGDPVVTLGVPTDIGTAIGANFQLTIDTAGGYVFRLFDIAGDLQSGLLVVRPVPIPGALLLLASGLFGLRLVRKRS